MNAYLIAFDITTKVGTPQSVSQVRTSVDSIIQAFPQYVQVTESCWCVTSGWTAKQIRDSLAAVVRKADRVFVLKYGKSAAWQNTITAGDDVKSLLDSV